MSVRGIDRTQIEPGRVNAAAAEVEAMRYMRARGILKEFKTAHVRRLINWQQYKALREKAVGGDVDGATRELAKLLRG